MNHRSQITDTQYTIHRYTDTQMHRCTDAQIHSTQYTDHKKSQNHNSQITNKTTNFNASMNNEE